MDMHDFLEVACKLTFAHLCALSCANKEESLVYFDDGTHNAYDYEVLISANLRATKLTCRQPRQFCETSAKVEKLSFF